MSATIGGAAKLVNHVYLVVPVSVTCPTLALDSDHFVQQEIIDVEVLQKVGGGTITMGSGSVFYNDTTLFGGGVTGTPLTCDGHPHTYSVAVFPNVDSSGIGVAFKGGKAVASVNVDIFIQNKLTFQGDPNNVNSGPVPFNIKS
jgi:hypothetical protein